MISVNKISAKKLEESWTSTTDDLELGNDCHHLINKTDQQKGKKLKGIKAKEMKRWMQTILMNPTFCFVQGMNEYWKVHIISAWGFTVDTYKTDHVTTALVCILPVSKAFNDASNRLLTTISKNCRDNRQMGSLHLIHVFKQQGVYEKAGSDASCLLLSLATALVCGNLICAYWIKVASHLGLATKCTKCLIRLSRALKEGCIMDMHHWK